MLKNNRFLRAGDDRDRLYYKYWQQFDEGPFWGTKTLSQFLLDFLAEKLRMKVDTNDTFEIYRGRYLPTLAANQGIEHELAECRRRSSCVKIKLDISSKM